MFTPWLFAFSICTIYLVSEVVVAVPPTFNEDMQTVFEWYYLDFVFESDTQRQAAIQSGKYNYTTNAPIDVDIWRDKIFVTIIRDEGVPSSLNVISNEQGKGGPLLKPYPNWNWTNTDCTGITSVYRVAIDRCNRLWVLDTGIIGNNAVCPPQLLVFDLLTDNLIERVQIPHDVAVNTTSGKGLLVTPVVQTFGFRCSRTFVYLADVEGYAILVYDGNSIRRITSSALVSDPAYRTYTIDDVSFTFDDGPVGMAISPLTQTLYTSPMTSHNMVSIKTRELIQSPSGNANFTQYTDVLTTQSSAKAMSRVGTLFFGLVGNTAIGCWHEFRRLTSDNIVVIAQNSETLQFTSGMKVKESLSWYGGETLLVLTNRFQRIATGTLNFNEINFRILKAQVNSLISGTLCMPPSFGR
ncbi:major royal jelly protein 9-like [Calliopsis andreniformis]|uniref:major royal jelly protein 9-like n=1 Tax=Calliopsis andreniformis TaxID=337506 RepID=UPI003FCCA763